MSLICHRYEVCMSLSSSKAKIVKKCNLYNSDPFSHLNSQVWVGAVKYFLEVINLSVYIFGKFRLFYVSGEEIVEKDARMSLLRLFKHI